MRDKRQKTRDGRQEMGDRGDGRQRQDSGTRDRKQETGDGTVDRRQDGRQERGDRKQDRGDKTGETGQWYRRQ